MRKKWSEINISPVTAYWYRIGKSEYRQAHREMRLSGKEKYCEKGHNSQCPFRCAQSSMPDPGELKI